jgi:RNA polymerase sigma factor (sigma-70 family)
MDPTQIPASSLEQHGRFVRALALRLLADEHQADDVAQEAWLRFLEAPPRSALDPRGWLAAVVRNLASNSRRSASRRKERLELAACEGSAPGPEAEIVAGEVVRSVSEAVAALPEPYRSTVLARYYHGWEPSRIARETGVPLATVKSRLQRSHALLRERLDRQHGSRESWSIALAPLAELAGSPVPFAKAASLVIAAAALTAIGFVAAGALRPRPAAPTELSAVSSSAAIAAGSGSESAISAESNREAVDAAPDAQPLRISGTLRNRPYEPLGLPGGPAPRVPLALRVVASLDWNADLLAEAAATTDEIGRFSFEIAQTPRAPAALILSAPEDDTWRALVFQLQVDDWAQIGVSDLVRSAHGHTAGVVVDSEGVPAANARLRIVRQGAEPAEVEVESDGAGRVRADGRGWITHVESSDTTSTVVDWDRPQILEEGGATGWRVVLARSAALEVRCVDARGDGIEGMRVGIQLDESEERELGISSDEARRNDGRTGTDGSARIERVSSGRKIVVTVYGDDDHQRWSTSAVHGDELVVGPAADAASPLVLSAGETRRLTVRYQDLVLRGRIIEPGGRGIPGAKVSIAELDDRGEPESDLAYFQTGPDGAFEQRVRAPILPRALQVVARQERDERPGKSELAELGYSSGSPAAAARTVTVDVAAARDGVIELDLVLEPLLEISGRLLDAQGNPLGRLGLGGVRLWATPSLADSRADRDDAHAELDPDGRFELSGLARGAWDLHVSEEIQSFYTWESFVHRFPSIEAGSSGVELRLERQAPVRIRIRAHGGEPDGLTVLHAKLFPRDASLPRENAPRSIRVSGVASWPLDAVVDFGGISGASDELGRWSHGFYGTEEVREHALQPFGAGWYVIGVHPYASRGDVRWFPQATKLLWFEPGDHEIDFDLVATTTLAGVVRGAPEDERVAVELATHAGERIPLERRPGFGRLAAGLEVDARGRFTLRHAPVGRYRLRVGTLAGLARGEARREIEVELSPGAPAPVEVRW